MGLIQEKRNKFQNIFKIAIQQSCKQSPPTNTFKDPPTTPTSSQISQLQSSTRI